MEEASKLAPKQSLEKAKKGLLQSNELYQYILETSVYLREPELLKELRDATTSHPLSGIATAPDGGQLMALLLKLINAKKTIEIGVFTGYSLLLTALSIPDDGKIIAIDKNQEAYEIGLPIIKKAGVEHKIDFIDSLALPVLDKLLEIPTNEGSFDFAYVDADKINYWNYHERLLKLVRIGGIIAYDNTLWGGTVTLPDDSSVPDYLKASWPHIIKFNKSLASDPRVQISQVPLGDGVTICLRLY
ncbi:putative caffeoyl-CoA O-methyltransferase [Cinnamomum micranthum f. kanehirae]|uniref:Putative caffeoyl-CoA O-methyltransferase n=1 Tax=Cinnamomum micranthum f. kanehirae TaxID=337451 RepID=A0A443NW69_9MAGN|nr:putative caffeoyl-CoA O-methyltransferase [Cinnamomum micranthum f. kanehirae]